MVGAGARELLVAEYRVNGLSSRVIAELVAEVGPLWHQRHQARLTDRPRRRAVGAGAKHKFVFIDRLLATMVSLRHSTTHHVLACWFGVVRSTITRAIGEVRPLLAQRGCTIAPGIRLCTLAEVIEHLGADGQTAIIDGTEIRVRRPAASRKDRDKFVSGKTKQNAVKSMVLTDAEGRVLFCSPVRPGSCADMTQGPTTRTGPAPGRRSVPGDPRGCRLSGHGSADQRPGGNTTAPQVQEESSRLVRGAARAAA
jgi:hypothetical protein